MVRRRIRELTLHKELFKVNERGLCYYTTPDTSDYSFPGTPHSICGVWYKKIGKRCTQNSPCIFHIGKSKVGEIGDVVCPFSNQMIVGNILTADRLNKLLPPKKQEKYNTRW